MADGRWQMANNPRFDICHLRFAMQDAFFQHPANVPNGAHAPSSSAILALRRAAHLGRQTA